MDLRVFHAQNHANVKRIYDNTDGWIIKCLREMM